MKHSAIMPIVCIWLSLLGCSHLGKKEWKPLYPSAMNLPKSAEERLLSLNPLWSKIAVINKLLYENRSDGEIIVVLCSIRPTYGGLYHQDFVMWKSVNDKDWSRAECYIWNSIYYHSFKDLYGLSREEMAKDLIPISKEFFKYDPQNE